MGVPREELPSIVEKIQKKNASGERLSKNEERTLAYISGPACRCKRP